MQHGVAQLFVFRYDGATMVDNRELTGLAGHLETLFGRRQWQALWQAHAISRSWKDLVGAEIAARSEPACIQKNTLWVQVRDSVWMQELQARKPGILDRIREGFPEADIRDIRWRLQQAEPQGHGAGEWVRVEPDPEEARAFAAMTATIDNKECREALYRLWLTFHRYRERR